MNSEQCTLSKIERDPAVSAVDRSWFYVYFIPPAVLAGRRVFVH